MSAKDEASLAEAATAQSNISNKTAPSGEEPDVDFGFSFTKLNQSLTASHNVPAFLGEQDSPSALVDGSSSGSLDIGLEAYLDAYTEVVSLLKSLGKGFYFVIQDVSDKMLILRRYRLGPSGAHYLTVRSMVQYERDNDVFSKTSTSGCRTLLRLHRALLFIKQLLVLLLDKSKEKIKFGNLVFDAYKCTLSQHHPWLIRKAVSAAVYLLPTRETFLAQTAKSQADSIGALEPISIPELESLATKSVIELSTVFTRVDNVYTQFSLHALP